jgi:UDP-3-O-[3-hydroxymyristoyl] N-acetylglucosamine deacetylase/3-hydroxyacyl-[acyl-carrier-protein] dehydratase
VEEFVRHKMLDIVGDLSLLGRPINGHIVAVKPSHAGNCELVRQIIAQMQKPARVAQTFSPPPPAPAESSGGETASGEGAMDIEEVMKWLPHRYPFLMVDRILKIEGNRIVGLKNVTMNEPFFQGHFPGHPIMPGVLQLEAMAQVAGILLIKKAEAARQIAYFMAAEDVKWRKPVHPGDTLIIDVELTKARGKIGKAKGVCKVGGEVVSEAGVPFMLLDA